ncbi:MAG: AMP-binding protein [Desulfovibrio sp.]|jgi:phenylacetate-coenzyme A ligase PaaK-like adenylate-forming protein|nr:AMP-binding protein [Desulfovibrio sp.]
MSDRRQADSIPVSPLDAWLAGRLPPDDKPLPARVRQAQTEALQRLLDYVSQRSSFYAGHLSGRDLHITCPEDLQKLPFTEPAHLRDWRKFLCVSHSRVQRLVSLNTSGTSGPPKHLAFTENDLAATRDFFRVGLSGLVPPGGRLAVLLPGGERPDGVTDQLRQALAVLNIVVRDPPPAIRGNASATAEWVETGGFHCLVATPEQLRALLAHLPQAPTPLRGVLSSADNLDRDLARALRRSWHCELLDHYGLTESGFGLGVECVAHSGYHLRELDTLVEIVDPDGDKSVPPGRGGEVVITTLHHEAMPLLRYRTGDAARFLPGPCPCGSPLRRLGPIIGRLIRDADGPRLARLPKGGRA